MCRQHGEGINAFLGQLVESMVSLRQEATKIADTINVPKKIAKSKRNEFAGLNMERRELEK